MRRMRSLLLSIGLAAALAGLDARARRRELSRAAQRPDRVRRPGGRRRQHLLDPPDGKGQKQLTKGPGFHLCPSFSADGRTIAYCSDVSGAWEIWTMRANGSKQRQLTHLDGFATFPDFSPDGKTIVFGGNEGADPITQIHTVNAKTGGGLHTLTSCAGFGEGCFNDLPVWSPDGTKIAFIHADDYDVVD